MMAVGNGKDVTNAKWIRTSQAVRELFLKVLEALPLHKHEALYKMRAELETTNDPKRAQLLRRRMRECVLRQDLDLTGFSMKDDVCGAAILAESRERIANRVRELRRQRDWSQETLADKADLPQSHISRIEKNQLAPTYMTIKKIAAAFGMTPGQFDTSYDE